MRPIDASKLLFEIQVCSWDSEQDKERAEDLVLGMPTLTPPNNWEDYCRRRERRTMDEYITPNYKTIGTVEQREIRELYTSSLLNAFTQQDYLDAIALIGRVIDRLEKLEK